MRATIVLVLIVFPTVSALAADVGAQKIDEVFALYNKPYSPGCSVGVIRDSSFIFRKSYGEGSLELGTPLSSDSVFYMASVSKQFTAASIVLAAEQGFLSLDDDVRKYIPELPSYRHIITLRQMLHQTSGLRDFLALTYLAGRDISALSSSNDVLKLIVRQKGAEQSARRRIRLQQHELLPARDCREARERKVSRRIRRCEHLPAVGHDQNTLLRR
jgi:CubicO group peptidase (beta-lactamase class C family)